MSAAMSFQPVLLWTDLLLFLLLGSAVLATLHVRANPPLREAWRRVGKRPTGMAAATILLAFVAVGVLDSLHFRPLLPAFEASSADVTPSGAAEAAAAEAMYSTEVLSLLDQLLTPLRLHTEKTYSAPFAAQLFQREAMELPDGRQLRGYPRLVHGAAHLQQPESEQAADIAGIQVQVEVLYHLVPGVAATQFAQVQQGLAHAWWYAGSTRNSSSAFCTCRRFSA